eukprot:TRINITY_DN4605_c5_g1_i1.p1 TRINITY_DN4605_c5_g1~~TRINITY_DN4605_c5_g1_i1.p1  ORF type:complete len:495 (+),score=121.56 TRINITY_DN4605_c5_g1_i1:80-1486(+)
MAQDAARLADADDGGDSFSMIQEYFPDELLREAAGQQDLGSVTHLEITFDAEANGVAELGRKLPQLGGLRASGSNVPALRDLGGTLLHLRVLWLNRSNVRSCAGAHALPNLEELYLAFNDVEDIAPLAGHPRLRVLDAESNRVSSLDDAELLAQCPCLVSLTLEGNPVCELAQYKPRLATCIPTLEFLDDEEAAPLRAAPAPAPAAPAPAPPAAAASAAASAGGAAPAAGPADSPLCCAAVDQLIADMRREISERRAAETAGVTDEMRAATERRMVAESIGSWQARPASAGAARPGTASRVGTPLQRGGASWRAGYSARPASAAGRPPSYAPRPLSSRGAPRSAPAAPGSVTSPGVMSAATGDASALTQHSAGVLCGNPTKSLRHRLLDVADSPEQHVGVSTLAQQLDEHGEDTLLATVAAQKEREAAIMDARMLADGAASDGSDHADLGGCEILRLSDEDQCDGDFP